MYVFISLFDWFTELFVCYLLYVHTMRNSYTKSQRRTYVPHDHKATTFCSFAADVAKLTSW